MTNYSVGIDIGGTFTDVACAGSDGSFRLMKVPTTRRDPAEAVRIAIVFLFSFLNPEHEQRAAAIIREAFPELMMSLSSEVDPAFREYERTCVTAFDAYIKPVVNNYLAAMERDLAGLCIPAPLQIMQSRGGIASAAT